ncbi:hypothetical protein U2F10_08035 [Leptothoe sp. EHU-05/26/07-4]
MPVEATKLIKQQPLDKPGADYPFPPLVGLDKPRKPTRQPPRRLSLKPLPQRYGIAPPTVSSSPFHGVTRLSLILGDEVSETFNNGKGNKTKKGKYFAEVSETFSFISRVQNPLIAWKVRNMDRFYKAKFELFAPGYPEAIWETVWDQGMLSTYLRRGELVAGSKIKDGEEVEIPWLGSIAWNDLVVDNYQPDFPNGYLPPEKGPYQLRLTMNDGKPGTDKMGYPLVAWTYFYTEPPNFDDDDDFGMLSLLVEEKAGVGYRLDDGMMPPSEGTVDEDGILVHPVCLWAASILLKFQDESETFEIDLKGSGFDDEDILYDEDILLSLQLIIKEKAGKHYIIDDGILPRNKGSVDSDGLLIHQISTEAEGFLLSFEDEDEPWEINLLVTD